MTDKQVKTISEAAVALTVIGGLIFLQAPAALAFVVIVYLLFKL